MLEINKITKIYTTAGFTQKALDNVSLKFRQNEFVSILGPSGSGKTTLLNIIGGLDHYTSGDLIINGISTKKYKDNDWDSYRNNSIGFVFQSYNLIPHQSILANVELALTLSGVSKKERIKRAKDVLKKVGLEKHINKKPSQLSGGQMQRVAIARALINNPDILLADEPTGALDSKTSIQILDLLKEIAKDKLVIMVTHNPDLANKYSNRIISLTDGKVTDDTNPYDGLETEAKVKLKKKVRMSYKTALSLSLNNLMTKKGRTILTAFAGSIGIIGIALILSLSNGIQNYIDRTEQETLGSYPLMIQKESVDMNSMLVSMMEETDSKEYDDDLIHSKNIMGNMLTSLNTEIKKNDLASFKEYLESDKTDIKDYVSDIQYGYDIQLNLYKNDDTVTRVNPTTIFDAIGMDTSGISNVYSAYMSNYDVFSELINNEELVKQQYQLVAGSWPKDYNEVIITVGENNEISDYTLYSLGVLSQDDLKKQFNNMIYGEKVEFEEHSYTTDELLDLSFKLVKNSDYYKKTNGVWVDMSDNLEYMKDVLKDSMEIKVVGIVKPNDESVAQQSYGLVLYTHDLWEKLINEINNSDIVKEQKDKKEINVFTGSKFSDAKFDINNLTNEQKMSLSKMSQEEMTEYLKTMADNMNATYEQNLSKMGAANLDDPDIINIYPVDFDAKEKIVEIIDEYNKGKKEEEKLQYTDIVGIMMSSVSSIVNVISTVLIAFVAISLIVSSIMIAIITYISVIERTKEIGILRAIGASKKDISRVFNAETLIEGASAGIMGIIVTLLLNIPINIIIKNTVNISNIASLPLVGGIILIIISILLTVIAGFIPAKIASKKDPVEALRTE